MSGLDPRRMKVTELRAELQRRGLDCKGLKAELSDRLQEALDSEMLGGEEERAPGSMEEAEEERALDLGEEEEEEDEAAVAEELEDEEEEAAVAAHNEEEAAEGAAQAAEEAMDKAPSTGDAAGNLNGAAQKEEAEGKAGTGKAGDGQKDKRDKQSRNVGGTRQGVKRVREEEQRGRTFHEYKEEGYFSRSKSPVPFEEAAEEVEDSVVCLDKATCDLQFKMDKDRFGGRPLFSEKFPSLWSGSRATHAVTKGKAYFEVKVIEKLPVKEGSTESPLLRAGWSVSCSAPQLGEDDLSFAYDGRGLKVTSGNFEPYGESFEVNDVIGCLANLDADPVDISFSKNGTDLGQAFTVDKSTLGEQALLPHILCKGCSFQVNFGQREEPWHSPPEGFSFLKDFQSEDLTRTPLPPTTTEECEVLLMIGLPGTGKTTWAKKHKEENPEKRYQHLSTEALIPQLKTAGPDTPEQDEKAKDHLVQVATQCLIRLIPVAARKKGNYIIDQCTVYSSAQRRKMHCFKGYQRKAVVLVLKDDEWKKRLESRKETEGEIVPDYVLLEMKANFVMPTKNDFLEEVIYAELGQEEADSLVAEAKKEARQKLPNNDKRGNRMQKRARTDRGRGGGNYQQQRNFNNRMFMHHSRPQPYHQQPPRQYWGAPQRGGGGGGGGGYQNFYDRYSDQQNRYYGQQQNYRPQNRGGWQNYNDRQQYWDYYGGYRGYR
ncbi:heterogeneous nuclear ribonucleoprotein U-like protein 2 isoform X2 [Hyla sarda]|uniref:heterogeneous nuclear ribonucleoprotein U-like protein 2 isoform X2 n=1 Tax=Hyla sarda TaxID=327740 RepID=UPI0024C37B10|nr:heterogeneous nuclear ribonucleoprotein U-like protein 2 isoform X2 [Hyla sarda]